VEDGPLLRHGAPTGSFVTEARRANLAHGSSNAVATFGPQPDPKANELLGWRAWSKAAVQMRLMRVLAALLSSLML
jgi:hypothetical protein